MQRMPRQNRAFDARRQIAHAGKHREPAEMMMAIKIELAGRHVAKFLDQCFGVRARLAFDDSGHHRRRCLADRAGFAMESDAVDALAVEIERNVEMVAAQRIMPSA